MDNQPNNQNQNQVQTPETAAAQRPAPQTPNASATQTSDAASNASTGQPAGTSAPKASTGQPSGASSAPTGQPPAEKKKKGKIILIAAIIVAVIALAVVVILGLTKEDKEPVKEAEVEEVIYGDEYLGIDSRVDEELKNYRNVVLFGVDTASAENARGHRSDGIIIVSFNKKTDEVKIFSVYRDTYLKIDDTHGLDKVNHAYAYGGMDQSIKALNQNLDLNIREGMAMTWNTISELVDSIDGVDIEILDSELSTLNGSLSAENKISGPGVHTLNGEQAVAYSRIRYDAGDHRRNERMQAVLIAALKKAQTMGTSKLIAIMDDTLDEVTTNMSRNKMTDTLKDIANFDITTNVCWPYDTSGWMYNEIYYGVPVTLNSNVIRLHGEFFGQENYDPTDFVKTVSTEIESISGYTN